MPTTIRLRYSSVHTLDADHGAYLTHGGMLVPWPNEADAPPPNSDICLTIEEPHGRSFAFAARVGQFVAGRGFMASFLEKSHDVLLALDAFLDTDAFRKALESEDEALAREPEVIHEPPTGHGTAQGSAVHGPPPHGSAVQYPPVQCPPALLPWGDTDKDKSGLFEDTMRMTAASDQAEFTQPDAGVVDWTPSANEEDGRGDGSSLLGADTDEYCLDSLDEGDPLLDNLQEGYGNQGLPEEGGVHRPKPGSRYFIYSVKYEQLREFLSVQRSMETSQRFPIDREEVEAKVGDVAQLRITLPGHNIFEMWTVFDRIDRDRLELRIDETADAFRKLCLYCNSSPARARMKNEAHMAPSTPHVMRVVADMPTEDPDQMPIRRRIARMGMDDKINLALSGNREERMALAMDSNRAIHFYLLKNAKITLDEIAFMARLPSMNPMVLDRIAENPSYTQNLQVTKSLVYNPKTPIKTAVRLLDRLPRPEIMNIAKRTQMHPRLVISAKNKLSNKKW